jgi:hypothetical protein
MSFAIPIRHVAAAALLLAAAPAAAQTTQRADLRGELFVGSEAESYLRVLQVSGGAGMYPWSVRGLSPAEVDRVLPADAEHPWGRIRRLQRDTAGERRSPLVRPQLRLLFNSTRPHGQNDGPVWAGRGVTAVVEGGVTGRWGPLSASLVPTAFVAQNADFELAPVPPGASPFAEPGSVGQIDHPQRFGDGSYARVDPGESTVRLDARGVAVAVSTASQQWGPAADLPILLGNNAGGFPHLLLGSSRPVNVGVGRLHGRLVWGSLAQSEQSPVEGTAGRRFMSGAVAVLIPRGAPGLELGGARFFHTPWPRGGLEAGNFLKPLEGLLKSGLENGGDDGSDVDNQLAEVFFRWVFPASGVEVYGEYAREDHSYDARDITVEPDHDAAYMLGLRRVWGRGADARVSLRAEVLDSRVSHLNTVRGQTRFYTHGGTRQGHTQRGQLLGAASGYAGGGSVIALDRYAADGRWTAQYTRQRGAPPRIVFPDPDPSVLHTVGVERLWLRGPMDLVAGVTLGYEGNRRDPGGPWNAGAVIRLRTGL